MEGQQKEENQWIVIEGVCVTPGAEGVSVFGVAHRGCGWCWSDVDTDRAAAERLAERLNRAQPELCHFAEMVMDFVEEEAGRL